MDHQPSLYSIVLIVVGHRERKDYWKKCLQSLVGLDKTRLKKIYIIIDGDEEDDLYMESMAYEELTDPWYEIQRISKRGKRAAMFYGFQKTKHDFPGEENRIDFVVTDSDTELFSDSCLQLQNCLRSHPNNGCATGLLSIYNKHDGCLPKLIDARYSYAFVVERGCTSYFGCMTCCSGPISIYKGSVLNDLLLKKFITQQMLSIPCEPGDDRHLTNLVMQAGYYSKQTNLAKAGTEAPETYYRFLLQQLRWSRSFYREWYWQIKAIPHQSSFLMIVNIYETLFPLFIAFWIGYILFWNDNVQILIKAFYLTLILLTIRTLLLILYLKSFSLLLNVFYYPLYLFLLLPTKLYAILTLFNNRWVTAPRLHNHYSCMKYMNPFFGFLLGWNTLFAYGIYVCTKNMLK